MKFCGVISSFAVLAAANQTSPNIVQLAQSVDSLSTLVAAVVAGDLVDTLSSAGPFTVFAPTNEAFAKLQTGVLDKLLLPENKDLLVQILTNHVLPKEVFKKDVPTSKIPGRAGREDETLAVISGKVKKLVITGRTSGSVKVCSEKVDNSYACGNVLSADNLASNGVVHIIDGVLVPSDFSQEDKPKFYLPYILASDNIVGLAQSVTDLSTLVAAVVAADLVETLSSPGPLTVLAPTNEAFAALPAGVLADLLKPENKATLVDILTYHVLPTGYDAEALLSQIPTKKGKARGYGLLLTVGDQPLRIASQDLDYPTGTVQVGPSNAQLKTVTTKDVFATNGVVHIIDGVMLPSDITTDLDITLTSFTESKCFGDEKSNFDIKEGACYQLSKVPESNQKLDQRILCQPNGDAVVYTYSTTDGSCSELFRRSFEIGEQFVKNGSCLTDSGLRSDGLKITCGGKPKTANIVELAESVSDLSTLVAAVVAGDLVDTLTSTGPFTVFAPTNEGFAALPSGTLDTLMKPANKAALVDILTYHVLQGEVLSTDLAPFQQVTTVEGKLLNVQKFGGQVQVGASLSSKDLKQVTSADNKASNGVVHIINGVMIPPSSDVVV